MTHLVIDALKRCGQRGVLSSGWGGLETNHLSKHLFSLKEAPHDWLFPQMAAVVHHGGAGTTAAGLRAGVPTIVVPHMQDQPYWGQIVHKLGAGPKPIPRKKLTAEILASSITQAVQDQAIIENARQIGNQIQAENGVGQAVKVIEAHFS
jgi:sterol 3beta-glucosyltransferase